MDFAQLLATFLPSIILVAAGGAAVLLGSRLVHEFRRNDRAPDTAEEDQAPAGFAPTGATATRTADGHNMLRVPAREIDAFARRILGDPHRVKTAGQVEVMGQILLGAASTLQSAERNYTITLIACAKARYEADLPRYAPRWEDLPDAERQKQIRGTEKALAPAR